MRKIWLVRRTSRRDSREKKNRKNEWKIRKINWAFLLFHTVHLFSIPCGCVPQLLARSKNVISDYTFWTSNYHNFSKRKNFPLLSQYSEGCLRWVTSHWNPPFCFSFPVVRWHKKWICKMWAKTICISNLMFSRKFVQPEKDAVFGVSWLLHSDFEPI